MLDLLNCLVFANDFLEMTPALAGRSGLQEFAEAFEDTGGPEYLENYFLFSLEMKILEW